MRFGIKRIIAAVFLAAGLSGNAAGLSAQEGWLEPPVPGERERPAESVGPVSFSVDTGVSYTEGGSPVIEVYLEAPYDELPFTRESGGYVSRVEVVAVFRSRSGEQVGGDSWNRDVWVKSYDETMDPENIYLAVAKFVMPPGEYNLKLTCGGLGSDLKGEANKRFLVPEAPEEGIWLSDVRLGVCGVQDTSAAQAGVAFVPNGGRSFGEETASICAIVDAYSRAEVDADSLSIEVLAKDENGRMAWNESRSVLRTGRETELTFGVPMDSLAWGLYSFTLSVRAGEHEASANRIFEVDETRVGVSMEIDVFIELMALVATEEELETFASLGGSERRAYLDGIWKRRDPDPSTPRNEFKISFFRRLKYAKAKFAEPGRIGWQTDRGGVFIKNGRPDRIDTREGVIGSMSPDARLEVWYYDATNTHYVFEDFGGNGEYTLVDVVQG